MKRFLLVNLWLLSSVFLFVGLAHSAPQKKGKKKSSSVVVTGAFPRCKVKWNILVLPDFKDADITTVVKWISKQTCQNFIFSNRLRGNRLTIISKRPVRLRDAYRAFFSALEANGMTVYRVGRYWKIIYARDASNRPIPLYKKSSSLPMREEMVTYIYRFKYIDINQIHGLIRQMLPSTGRLIIYNPSNTMILIDYAANIRRIAKIIQTLDIPQESTRDRIYVLKIKYAEVQTIAQKLTQLFQIGRKGRRNVRRARRYRRRSRLALKVKAKGKAASDEGDEDAYRITKMVADERTNQLIVLCNPRALRRISKLLKDLDIPLPYEGQIWVHRLQFANSDELAQTLSQLTRGTRQRRYSRRYRRSRRYTRRKAAEQFEGEVKITSDKATNSLVVIASRRDFESLLKVIKQLDIPRKQVFIEIVILEVSQEKARELGLTFHKADNLSSDKQNPILGILGTRLGGSNSLILDPAALTGLAFGLRGATLPNTAGLLGPNIPGIPSFGVLIRALQTSTDVDIISTPHILTTANKEASLQVGQNVPFIAGTTYTGVGIAGIPPIRNIQRQDVALTLKIKPQVNAGNYVRLDFEGELTELAGNDPELGPTTTKRRVKTVIIAKDRQTVVIGGLIRDRVSYNVSKIPVLGDIPFLGTLFRYRSRNVEKRNLLIFLTPYIIREMEDFRRIFKEKMRERQQFIALYQLRSHPFKWWETFNPSRSHGFIDYLKQKIEQGEREAREIEEKVRAEEQREDSKESKKGEHFEKNSKKSPPGEGETDDENSNR